MKTIKVNYLANEDRLWVRNRHSLRYSGYEALSECVNKASIEDAFSDDVDEDEADYSGVEEYTDNDQ